MGVRIGTGFGDIPVFCLEAWEKNFEVLKEIEVLRKVSSIFLSISWVMFNIFCIAFGISGKKEVIHDGGFREAVNGVGNRVYI